jgi:hypothetical protein
MLSQHRIRAGAIEKILLRLVIRQPGSRQEEIAERWRVNGTQHELPLNSAMATVI